MVCGATNGCAANVLAAIGREAKLLLWKANGWEVVLLNRASVSSGNGDCTASDAMGAYHES